MTAPEVDFVLSSIEDFWPGNETDLSHVPLERIDRDNSDLLDDTPIHQHSVDLEEMNYVGAASATRDDRPIGTEYDLATDRIVSVRVEGAHVSEFGAIDPQKDTADETTTSYNTTAWDTLTENVRRAVLNESSRMYPNVTGRPNVGFKDLFVENYADTSSQYSDYYRVDFDVRFSGFETLP